MLRKFIKSSHFATFEETCLRFFDDGWVPSAGQPFIATHSNSHSTSEEIYVLLIEKKKQEKITKKGF